MIPDSVARIGLAPILAPQSRYSCSSKLLIEVPALLCSAAASTLSGEQPPQQVRSWDCATLNGDCVAGVRGECGVPASKSRKLLAYLSALAHEEK